MEDVIETDVVLLGVEGGVNVAGCGIDERGKSKPQLVRSTANKTAGGVGEFEVGHGSKRKIADRRWRIED